MDTFDPIANSESGSAASQSPLDVGMALRAGRERLGMSVHDVAERIKFAPKQVEALEANDFAHLPEPAFLRGFVRSYARVLQLDEATLIAALPGAAPARQAENRTQAVNVVFPVMKSLRRVNAMWLAGALVVAIVLGLFVLLHRGEPLPKQVQVVEPVSLPPAEPAVSAVVAAETPPVSSLPEADGAGAERKAATMPSQEPPKAIAELPRETRKEPAGDARDHQTSAEPVKTGRKPVVKPVPQIEAASAPAATQSAIPLEALKRRPLHLVFGESAWAEVIDGHGVVLLSRNNARGTEKWIGGPRHEPYDISISNPANVKLYYRGREIDLSAYAGKDVAHLKVE
ncbi:cytoskeleton protein RodZ [Sideroxyarcus emersonii]|uniref:Cytoskeleton protein RodZ n=2 Tax=Sideroxyarcus emersonii TaxID=2764705 RepID=A0AAN1XAC5_9PROT|nr:cytoskeleton protein RodZ [Sideroxyarcus emersonii]